MDYDVIVIGSGLGGLTAAAMLAKEQKKKVLVIEQHYIPGGCATVFQRHGVTCEVGLHEMDMGAPAWDMKHAIFEKLELDKRVPWIDLPQTWRMRTESQEYTIPEGREEAIAYLIEKFPHEKRGIKAYFRAMGEVSYSIRRLPPDLKFWDFFFFPITTLPIIIKNWFQQATVAQKMDKMIKDNKLKRLLNVNIVYYHDDPETFSWFYHSAAQNAYYNGARFVKGGSQVLSNVLVDIIKENGGDIKLFCEVEKIMTEGKKATSVVWRDKRTKEMHEATANIFIANCSPGVVYKELLPPEYEDMSLRSLKPSISLYTVYLIFKKNLSQLYPGNAYSTFMGTDAKLNNPLSTMGDESRDVKVQDRNFVLVDYSAVDSGLVPPGDERSFGVLTGLSYLEEWENISIEKYRAKKDELAHALFARLEKFYPGITENIAYYEVSTPKTVQRYLHCPAGTAYGFMQTGYLRGRLGRTSPTVKNLHFASAWGFPGGGFTGAIISGYITALNIKCPLPLTILWRTLVATAVGTALGTIRLWIGFIIPGLGH